MVKRKMTTQMYALSRTTASTWGSNLRTARQTYLAIIRPALAYGSVIWHTPSINQLTDAQRPITGPQGPAKSFRLH